MKATQNLSDILRRVSAETLENLAFTELADSHRTDFAGAADAYRGCRISMGTLGTLNLAVSHDFLTEIAGILFQGADGLDPSVLTEDALNELANIIAGRFLEALFQGGSDFEMGLPEPHLDGASWAAMPVKCVLQSPEGGEMAVGIAPAAEL
ncbi:MAG TPA: hypothetical protein VJ385_13450 [Fibrobacteria bacterium]|nr:hypothetical protein [Fibrobacteria bacterium]